MSYFDVYTVYLLERKNDGKKYIGFTCDLERRLYQHKRSNTMGGEFTHKVIYQSKDQQHALDMEEFFISKYDTFHNGLNKTKCGKGCGHNSPKFTTRGYKFSEESRKKMSESAKQKPHIKVSQLHTDEVRKKLSNTRRGKLLRNNLKLTDEEVIRIYRDYQRNVELEFYDTRRKYKTFNGAFVDIYSKKYGISDYQMRELLKGKTYQEGRPLINAKLTIEQARRIRKIYENINLDALIINRHSSYKKAFCEEYGSKFGVSSVSIKNIVDEKLIQIKDLINGTKRNNRQFKIKTPNGLENFYAIRKVTHDNYVQFRAGEMELKCSLGHKVLTPNGYVFVKDLSVGDLVITEQGISTISVYSVIDEPIELYDVIDSGKDNCYISNGIVSHNCAFLSDKGTLIASEVLESIRPSEPIRTHRGMNIYADIASQRLAIGIDVGNGIGQDYSVIQVINLDTLEQVAQYRDNTSGITEMAKRVIQVLEYLYQEGAEEIYYTVEGNPIGQGVIELLENASNPILNKAEFISEYKSKIKGIYITNKNKLRGCSRFKDLVEADKFKIHSKELLTELKFFVKSGASFKAETGMHDDVVMSTIVTVLLIEEVAQMDDDVYDNINTLYNFDPEEEDDGQPLPFIF